MVKRRCTRCNKMLPLSNFDTLLHPVHCKKCRTRTTRANRRGERNELVYARRAACRALGNRCQSRYCGISLTNPPEEAVWHMAPRTVQARRMMAELSALDLYSLSQEVLTKHFKALCAVHYYKHVLKEEACTQPPIPVAGLRRVKSKRSVDASKRSSRKGTRTSGGKGTPTS